MTKFRCLAALIICLSVCGQAFSANKIKCHFNHPVDASVAHGPVAVNLSGAVDDTLIAYINRAKYTIDVAVYNFTYSSSIANVATAINNAYSRGVQVRWIYDGSSTNSGLSSVNSAIPRLASPTTSGYTIMHNKFMIIDANSSSPDDAIVWTGSTNWSSTQFNNDYDNIIIIQDSALAHAYLAEFNMMWGSTGATPNASLAKFGSHKTDLGRHHFYIEGKHVELYFSPSDNTNTQLVNAINSADKDLYLGMYTLTYNTNSNAMVARKNAGVYVAAIVDQFSAGNSAFTTLSSALGSNFIEYTGAYLYHNKYLIVDPSDACSDPLVVTGSHNWSLSANTDNDENTLIVHDDTVANQYYQSFRGDFNALGGSLSSIGGCRTNVAGPTSSDMRIALFPNPTTGTVTIEGANSYGKVTIQIRSVDGRELQETVAIQPNGGAFHKEIELKVKGACLVTVTAERGVETHFVYVY
ncbi:MAG: hypothetical protein EBZ77_01605 [Chitinophagia bacterium]|nr:hypothetical protein [Chitinophagia bacterium]